MASKTQAFILLLLPLLLLSHFISSHGYGIVTYWGQNVYEGELDEACATEKYEIINIAFLSTFGNGVTPEINLSGHCSEAWGVPCSIYASQITYCQSLGVKIFLSLGGPSGTYSLSGIGDAKQVADYLWTNFLGGQTGSGGPLGNVVLDGIDLDIESGGNLYYDTLVEYLYAYSRQQKIYLSAAPHCPIPDYYLNQAISTWLLDYIWIQFYGNSSCEYSPVDPDKFFDSWDEWTTEFYATKFYVGLPANPHVDGYIPIDDLNNKVIPRLKATPKFGGIMLWSRYYDAIYKYSDGIVFDTPTAPTVNLIESA